MKTSKTISVGEFCVLFSQGRSRRIGIMRNSIAVVWTAGNGWRLPFFLLIIPHPALSWSALKKGLE
jgi:hypothetical protein